MRPTFAQLRMVGTLSAIIATNHIAGAASFDWSGASGVDNFWATPGNWLPIGPPGLGDNARFFDPAAVSDATVNNVVTGNRTIRSLWFGQTNGFHNMLIQPGVTLTVAGTNDNGFGRLGSDPTATAPNPNVASTLYVGTKTEAGLTTVVTARISGEGTLFLDNTNNEVNIRQAWGAGGGAHRAVLDMSGLNTFRANLSRIRVGDGEAGAIRRAEAQLFLAKTNRITLSGPSVAEDVQLLVGNNDVNNNGNGSISHLVLGQDNVLNVDHILIGARKQQGNMRFLETLIAPSVIMRGSDGSSRVTAIRIGDESDQANSGNPTTGRLDLGLGTSDILANTVIVGKGQQQTGREGIGFLTLGPGTLDVNQLEVAYQTSETADNRVDGTVSFNGTTVRVNSMLRLGRSAGAAPARNAILNINGGSVSVAGTLATEGTATINITNGILALGAASPVRATIMRLDGGTVSNASLIRVTNSLLIVNGGTILGSPVLDLGNIGTANWDVQGAPGGGLTVSNTLQGSGNYTGDLVQAPGATISPGGTAVGTLSILGLPTSGNATFNAGTLRFDLANSSLGNNDRINVAGILTLNGTNDVNLTAVDGTFGIGDPYTLITSGILIGDETYFRVSGALGQSRYTFLFDTTFTPNGVTLLVEGTGPGNLTWVGDGSANLWNLKGAANWTSGTAAEQFYSLDAVTFNDSGSASPSVNLVGPLTPGSITVNNPTKNYTFTGNGGVQGSPLTKDGAGSLSFGNSGNNTFSGPVTIQAGAVTFSNNGLNAFANGLAVNGGSLTFTGGNTNIVSAGGWTIGAPASVTVANANASSLGPGPIQLDGTLTINQAVDSTVEATISGAGSLNKSGAGTLTLANNNSGLTSTVHINGGTVKAGAPSALGALGAIIAAGASLNINGQNLLPLAVNVSGAGPDGKGALVNTASPQLNALANVTLASHTTFGGSGPWNTDPVLNRGRWDIRGGSLSTGGQLLNLTKTGSNQVTLAGVTVDLLGDIEVQQGLLGFEGSTTSMGDAARTLTVRAGATLSFFDTTTAWNKRFVVFGNGVAPTVFNWNGANTIVGPVTLNGNCLIGGAPADRGTPVSLTLSGTVDGSGSLTKIAADRLVLGNSYTYTGDTTVNAGTLVLAADGSIPNSPNITIHASATLDAASSFGGALTIVNGQTLKGNGTVAGSLIAAAGSTISPGLSVGVLTASGDITLDGTTLIELNAALHTNDLLIAATFIDLGGTLRLTNVAGNFAVGDSFKLFDAPGIVDSFTSIIPATPGSGLTWDISTLATDGTLRIRGPQGPQISAATTSGGALHFSGTGGAASQTYRVLSATSVVLPVASWTPIQTNTFDANGNFSVTIPVSLSTPQRFFLLSVP